MAGALAPWGEEKGSCHLGERMVFPQLCMIGGERQLAKDELRGSVCV